MSTALVKEALCEIFEEQRARCQKSLDFYRNLEMKVTADELWKYQKTSPFYDALWDLVPSEPMSPTVILSNAIETTEHSYSTVDAGTVEY